MGAWAVDSFGNDTACDWAYGLEEVSDLSLVCISGSNEAAAKVQEIADRRPNHTHENYTNHLVDHAGGHGHFAHVG